MKSIKHEFGISQKEADSWNDFVLYITSVH